MFTASEIKTLTLVLDDTGQPAPTQPWIDLSLSAKHRPRDFQVPVGASVSVASGSLRYRLADGASPTLLSAGQSVQMTGSQFATFSYYVVSNGSFQLLQEANAPFIDVSALPTPPPLAQPPYSVVQSSLLSSKASVAYVDEQVALLQGQIGAASDRTYTHNQASPASTWTVNHNLGKFPAVTIINSAGDRVFGNENHTSVNQVVLTFETGGFSGKAYCN